MKLAIVSKVKHGVIFQYIQENNITAKELAKQIGIAEGTLHKFINMKSYPKKKFPASKKVLLKLCKFFKCKEKDIFPNQIKKHLDEQTEIAKILQNTHITYSEPNLVFLPSYDNLPQKLISYEIDEDVFKKTRIEKALKTLNLREEKIIRLRFELGLSYEKIAKQFNMTRERIRQIESKALRKLRHPKRGLSSYNPNYKINV
jgi:RNA polymerase sigma factor (sigma-70 family)